MRKFLFAIAFLLSTTLTYGQTYVTTYAGTGTAGFVNGDTAVAKFSSPFGMCKDKNGNIYVADGGNNCIRKINTFTNTVSTFAGNGVAGYADGMDSLAQFNSPSDICVDDSGNVYVSDFLNHRIRKISYNGMVSTIAGNGIAGYSDGSSDSAEFNYPRGICMDKTGNLYIGDSWNHRIRKISPAGNVTTFAGSNADIGVSSVGDYVDASDTSARFYTPAGLAIDKDGNIYVADAYNHRIRKIDTSRVVTTIAGSGNTGPGNGGYANGNTNVALLNTPTEIYVDSTGKVYISDTFNNRVRLLNSGVINTICGKGIAGFADGIDTSAKFNYPRGIVANSSGDKVYVVDYNNHAVRLIDVDVSGMDERDNSSSSINIYPNPNTGIFNITWGNKTISPIVNCKITDVLGKEVFHQNFSFSTSHRLSLTNLADGIYVIIITSSDYRIVKKIIKHS